MHYVVHMLMKAKASSGFQCLRLMIHTSGSLVFVGSWWKVHYYCAFWNTLRNTETLLSRLEIWTNMPGSLKNGAARNFAFSYLPLHGYVGRYVVRQGEPDPDVF